MKLTSILKNKNFKDFSLVVFTNSIELISALSISFLLPIFISIDDYSYVKIFMLYSTYIALFGLGFSDGVYIEYGELNYSDLPINKFNGFIKHLLKVQILFSIILIIIFNIFDL